MQPFGENTPNIPAFLGKLWKMVNDPNTDHLICWSPNGNSFVIQNQAHFWYELLPMYYKHNNMSSFVRQLNMYGFHKISSVDSGTMDAEKDEIQFYHRFFQKSHPELLRNIKRKITVSKSENNIQNVSKSDHMAQVLIDIEQLKGRQTSVDTQLTEMKQENAVLWRELALLRQKHMKQQQIVNKLIQFLVTLVQPAQQTRMGVVKRRAPLMIHESPVNKKPKTTKPGNRHCVVATGPTIHELDSEIEMSREELFAQEVENIGMVTSPNTESNQPLSVSSDESDNDTSLPENFLDEPEFVEINQFNNEHMLVPPELNEGLNEQSNKDQRTEKVFSNPNTRDTPLTGLVDNDFHDLISSNKKMKSKNVAPLDISMPNTNVITKEFKINSGTRGTNKCSREDLDSHLESAQNEIDNLKDILHGCSTLDPNTLLGVCGIAPYAQLFNDNPPTNENNSNPNRNRPSIPPASDPMVSGTALGSNNLIDFNELFDEALDDTNNLTLHELSPSVKNEPGFNTLDKDL